MENYQVTAFAERSGERRRVLGLDTPKVHQLVSSFWFENKVEQKKTHQCVYFTQKDAQKELCRVSFVQNIRTSRSSDLRIFDASACRLNILASIRIHKLGRYYPERYGIDDNLPSRLNETSHDFQRRIFGQRKGICNSPFSYSES